MTCLSRGRCFSYFNLPRFVIKQKKRTCLHCCSELQTCWNQNPPTNHPAAYLVTQCHKATIGHVLFYLYTYLHLDHLRVWEDIKEQWKVSSSHLVHLQQKICIWMVNQIWTRVFWRDIIKVSFLMLIATIDIRLWLSVSELEQVSDLQLQFLYSVTGRRTQNMTFFKKIHSSEQLLVQLPLLKTLISKKWEEKCASKGPLLLVAGGRRLGISHIRPADTARWIWRVDVLRFVLQVTQQPCARGKGQKPRATKLLLC